MAGKKYYAVASGRQPGIYTSWKDCQRQVIGCKGAQFKGFMTLAEAEAYMTAQTAGQRLSRSIQQGTDSGIAPEWLIYVDGSYKQGDYSWGFAVYHKGELTATGKGKGTSAAAAQLRNVAGEMEGARQAVLWAEANGAEPVTICHDYAGVAEWPLGNWQAKLPQTQAYAKFMQERLDWVQFAKVTGHTGVEGNELADKLAKEALE